jgi:hypothetical protein
MDTRQNKQLILHCYELFKDKNIKDLIDFFDDTSSGSRPSRTTFHLPAASTARTR